MHFSSPMASPCIGTGCWVQKSRDFLTLVLAAKDISQFLFNRSNLVTYQVFPIQSIQIFTRGMQQEAYLVTLLNLQKSVQKQYIPSGFATRTSEELHLLLLISIISFCSVYAFSGPCHSISDLKGFTWLNSGISSLNTLKLAICSSGGI